MRKFRECPNIQDEIVFKFFFVPADVSGDGPIVGTNNELFSAIYVFNTLNNGNLTGVVLMFFIELYAGVFSGQRMYILRAIFRTLCSNHISAHW
jgi:hypothetical protein